MTTEKLSVETMDAAIVYLRAKYPDVHCVRMGNSHNGVTVYWVIKDRKMPTEAFGRGTMPYHAWLNARENVEKLG